MIPESVTPGEENTDPLQCYCLEISMNRGAWQAPKVDLVDLPYEKYEIILFYLIVYLITFAGSLYFCVCEF